MKILSIYCTGRAFLKQGADWVRISSLGRALIMAGHEVDYVHYNVSRPGGMPLDGHHFFKKSSFIGSLMKHARIMRNNRYDVVIGNTHYGYLRSYLGRLAKPGIPHLFDVHGDVGSEFLAQQLPLTPKNIFHLLGLQAIDLANLRTATHVTCVSRFLMAYLYKKWFIPKDKMSYITNGVDLDFFKHDARAGMKIREELHLEDDFVFGYIGGNQSWQGLDKLVETVEKHGDGRFKLLVVGSDVSTKTEHVISVPRDPRDEVIAYYSACDVFVLPRPLHPSTIVAAPTKFVEYSAMGKPVLATNVGEAGHYVKKWRNGILVKDNSVESLRGGIEQFLDTGRKDLEKMGKRSRALASTVFNWKIIGRKFVEIVEDLA